MYSKSRISEQQFLFPRINKPLLYKKQQKSLLKYNNSLISYETELKSQSIIKCKKRVNRLKTVDFNQNQTFDQLRRQLKSVKNTIDYKFNQYNNKIQDKIIEYNGLLSKKQSPQIIYQPFPMVLPFMSPQISRNSLYQTIQDFNSFGYSPQRRYSKNNLKQRKPLFKSLFKLTFIGRKFRIAGWVIIFMNRLKKFNLKIIKFRKESFTKFIQQQFKQEANSFKRYLVQSCKQFIVFVLQKQDYQLKYNDRDSQNFKKQKNILTHKNIELLNTCILRSVQSNQFDKYIRLIYYFSRHGSFACLLGLLTYQQLQNLSVSEKNHYLQAERNLQKSQIINFVFMKFIIYNILGKTQKIDTDKFSKQKQILHQNIHLITSILYQLLMMIQEDYIVSCPEQYKLGNFSQVKAKIYPSNSLTIKVGQFRKNQIISGLIHENYLKSTYKLQKQWLKQRNFLIQIISAIHKKIVNYHRQFIKQFL